ncbi:MAG TPA: hypothetical protein DCX54_05040 [Flavobacteriales bacterium]|nr:hypothetical protein [Flavobacteriales bacterium]
MQIQRCTVCNSEQVSILKAYEKHKLTKCTECSMVFAWDIPDSRELIAHYEEYGRDDYKSPITVKRYREILSKFEHARSLNRILDIGCGMGFFLEVAQELNWKTYGTEYTETAVENCRQKDITMFKGDLSEINFGELTFDVITCIEVIEHIQDLHSFISGIKKILRPGGLLYLTTPNIRSLNSRMLKEDWNVLCYPEHLSYFSKKSLNKLLESNSFEKLFLVSDGVSPERLLTSIKRKTVDHSTSENKDEKLRIQLEKNSFLKTVKRMVNGLLNTLNLGESLKGLYRFTHDDRILP